MKYREFLRVLEAQGFELDRTRGTHRQYKAMINGQSRLVTVDFSQPGQAISTRNLASMIRQSGLSKRQFRG